MRLYRLTYLVVFLILGNQRTMFWKNVLCFYFCLNQICTFDVLGNIILLKVICFCYHFIEKKLVLFLTNNLSVFFLFFSSNLFFFKAFSYSFAKLTIVKFTNCCLTFKLKMEIKTKHFLQILIRAFISEKYIYKWEASDLDQSKVHPWMGKFA